MEWSELASAYVVTELARMEGLPPYGLTILQRLDTSGPQTKRELAEFVNEPPEAVETTMTRLRELQTFGWLTERGFVEAASTIAEEVDPALELTLQGQKAIHRILRRQDALITTAAG